MALSLRRVAQPDQKTAIGKHSGLRKRRFLGKRKLDSSGSTRVLIISENALTSGKITEGLRRNPKYQFEVFLLNNAANIAEAMRRTQPEVIVCDNWFASSDKGFWDVMSPFSDSVSEKKVVVIAEMKINERFLPTQPSYFKGSSVISANVALDGSSLSKAILFAKQEARDAAMAEEYA